VAGKGGVVEVLKRKKRGPQEGEKAMEYPRVLIGERKKKNDKHKQAQKR